MYEKTATRRSNAVFNPKGTITKLKQGDPPEYLDEEGRKDLIRQYLDVSLLIKCLCLLQTYVLEKYNLFT